MVRVTGWRAVVLLLFACALAMALVFTLLWAAILVAVLGLVFWLNVAFIPRLARRLRVSRWMLDLFVLVALCAGGWLLSGVNGTIAGAVVWIGGIGAPRAIGAWLRQRVRYEAASRGQIIEVIGDARPDQSERLTRRLGPPD